MTIAQKCQICHSDLMYMDRVIFSHRDTFVFKPANVPDTVNAAKVSPQELAESRKEHLKTAVVNTFCDWEKAVVPEGAFNFRHQWCEPVRTASSAGGQINRHAIRFARMANGRARG